MLGSMCVAVGRSGQSEAQWGGWGGDGLGRRADVDAVGLYGIRPGTMVTGDALNCQRDIAQRIVDQGGDYVLPLKGNQGTLHTDVRLFLDDPETRPRMPTPRSMAITAGSNRACTVSTESAGCRRFTTGPAAPPSQGHRSRESAPR